MGRTSGWQTKAKARMGRVYAVWNTQTPWGSFHTQLLVWQAQSHVCEASPVSWTQSIWVCTCPAGHRGEACTGRCCGAGRVPEREDPAELQRYTPAPRRSAACTDPEPPSRSCSCLTRAGRRTAEDRAGSSSYRSAENDTMTRESSNNTIRNSSTER